ncbi:MAG: MFS transporter [Phycisphaerales bacterium]|nr:MAG: MFS transporter [Phycisphaerales bacterium]
MNRNIAKFHWMQLLVLAAVHFVVDMFSGMPPAILPAIRNEFGWELSRGAFVLVVLYLTCNGVQVLTGHVRSGKRQPLLMHLGLLLAAGICLLAALPKGSAAFPIMLLLAVVSGFGIAIVHPESLRAVHRLKRIPPAVSTAVFMAGGFLGYASGGGISAYLVSNFGFKGLYPLLACSVVVIIAVLLLRVRLAVEPKVPNERVPRGPGVCRLPFWLIFAMAMPAAVSTTILAVMLPTVLVDGLGFNLTFGGYSTTVFGLGGAAGSFFWAHIARRRGELACTIAALFLTGPLLFIYLMLIRHGHAICILPAAGFCTIAAYTLMITLARHARGPTLGRRMGIMVGGTWALAYVVFMGVLFGAERLEISTNAVLNLTPWGYLVSGGFGVLVALNVVGAARLDSRPQADRE